MSGPRPHIEPTRKRSVRKALYGPAVVHCKAWASSLRVDSSGADMDPTYPSTDKAYILKSQSRSTRLSVDKFIFLALWMIFSRYCPTVNMALRTDHGVNILGVFDESVISRNSSQLVDTQPNKSWQFSVPYCTQEHYPMIQVEPSHLVHHHKKPETGQSSKTRMTRLPPQNHQHRHSERVEESLGGRVSWDDRVVEPSKKRIKRHCK